jgi:hypothetical protein
MAAELGMDLTEAQKEIIVQLNELDEMHQEAFQHIDLIQQQREKWHDRFIKKKQFKVGDWALLFDSRFKDFKGKFNTHWLGPYEIEVVFNNGSVKIQTIDDEKVSFLVNGHRLKLYQNPKSKGEFVKDIMEQVEMQMVGEGVSPHPSSS